MFSEKSGVGTLNSKQRILLEANCNDDRRRVWYMGRNSIK
jgi:hypothetical protein